MKISIQLFCSFLNILMYVVFFLIERPLFYFICLLMQGKYTETCVFLLLQAKIL